MFESNLTKFIRAIRQKNNISDIKAAYRCGVSLSEYILLEKNVETLGLSHLKTIFEAIEMSSEELLCFQDIALSSSSRSIKDIKLKNIC